MRKSPVALFGLALISGIIILAFGPFGQASSGKKPAVQAGQRIFQGRRPMTKSANLEMRRAAQAGPVYWVKRILQGGSLKSLLPTGDGGFFINGHASFKYWTLKLNSDGTVAWAAERLSSSELGVFRLNGIIPTADGNIIGAAGFNSGTTDAGVVKFTPDGDVLWAKSYGGPHVDHAYWISQAQDGGFLVTGNCISYWGGGPSDASYDAWVIKIDPTGAVEWERAFACLDEEAFFMEQRDQSGVQLADGGYAVVANTRVAGSGEYDFLLIKLDASGHVEWQKTYGGPGYESLFRKGPHLQATTDGGMILAGSTTSFGSGNTDIWVLKLAADGDIQWQKAIGGVGYEYCNSIRVAPDGGYVMAGDAGGRFGLIKLSEDGEIEWDGGYGGQYAESLSITGDGGYVLGGGGDNLLVMKTSPLGLISDSCGFGDPPQHAVQDTNAIPVNVWFEPIEVHPYVDAFEASFDKGPVIFAETLCWNLNQPPAQVTLTRSINRGLFRGEAYCTLSWSPNPANAAFDIVQYRVYRKVSGAASSDFRVIGTVPGNYLTYLDPNLDMRLSYDYALTSVDSEGHESPKSIVMGGGLVQ
jgi:hypothetical protein